MTGGDSESNGKRMYVVAGATALAVIGLAAFLMWPRTPEYVLVVGDSVTYQSWDELDARFDSETSLDLVARPGFRSADLMPLAIEAIDKRASAGHSLERAIFLVGYNDVWLEDVDHDGLETMVTASARYECAIWLTLPTRPGGEPPGIGTFDPEIGDAWNERVAGLVAEHDNLHLVTEWADQVEAADPGTYLVDDGIHPNDAGQELLARIMHDHIMSACRFP